MAKLKVRQSYGKKGFIEVNFLINSGAVYSLIPRERIKKDRY